MSHTVSIEETGSLAKLIAGLLPGEEITLTSDNQPVAKVIPQKGIRRRQGGACKGMLIINHDDDSHLADFKDYMQ